MNETLQYIDQYFTGELNDSQRIEFEKRCEDDRDFAGEVAAYISMRAALRQSLHDSKKKEFETLYREKSLHPETSPAESPRKVVPLLAFLSGIAATIFIVAGLYFYNRQPDAQRLAEAYITNNLQNMSVTMGAEQDSLALGINAYNEKNYARAERIFKSLAMDESVGFESTKYLGLVYLQTDSYENAIMQFQRLLEDQEAFANPGLFYKAVTLMKRSQGNDVEEAKKILQTIVQNKMAGYKEAERWLEKLD